MYLVLISELGICALPFTGPVNWSKLLCLFESGFLCRLMKTYSGRWPFPHLCWANSIRPEPQGQPFCLPTHLTTDLLQILSAVCSESDHCSSLACHCLAKSLTGVLTFFLPSSCPQLILCHLSLLRGQVVSLICSTPEWPPHSHCSQRWTYKMSDTCVSGPLRLLSETLNSLVFIIQPYF